MFSIISTIIALSLLLLIHEFGHFIAAKKAGVRVEKFSFGFGPKLIGFTKGDTQYQLCCILFGGYIKMAGENFQEDLCGVPWEYLSKSVKERLGIVLAGPMLNYILGFLIFSLVFLLGEPTVTTKVGALLDGFPAKEAGIKSGDRIIAIDGKRVDSWDQMSEIIRKRITSSIILLVDREGQRFELEVRPKVKKVKDIFGEEIEVGVIGIQASDEVIPVRHNIFESLFLGGKSIINLTTLTYKGIWRIVTARLSLKENLISPLGIFYLTRKAAGLGFIYLLQITAILSGSLAIFNLLPIPLLDGGHIIFLGLEKFKGKGVSQKVQERVTPIMIFLLISLMSFVFYWDLVRFKLLDRMLQWWNR